LQVDVFYDATGQVQGGGLSFVIGAQVLSLSSFRGSSVATAESTIVTEMSVILSTCRFFGGKASTVTNGGTNSAFVSLIFNCAELLHPRE
jgi:hypothetical protein